MLRDKAFSIGKKAKYDGYQRSHTFMVSKSFDKIYPQVMVL